MILLPGRLGRPQGLWPLLSPSKGCCLRLLVLPGERIQGQTQAMMSNVRGKFTKMKVHFQDVRAGELKGQLCPLGIGFPTFIDSC